MGTTTAVIVTGDHSRTPVAERLLAAPELPAGDWHDLDWGVEPLEGAPWASWSTVSLRGTPAWDRLNHAQRVEICPGTRRRASPASASGPRTS